MPARRPGPRRHLYSQSIAGLLSDLRAIHGVDRATIAYRAGVTPSAASRWECGSSTPSLDVDVLAKAYGATEAETSVLRWLLDGDAD